MDPDITLDDTAVQVTQIFGNLTHLVKNLQTERQTPFQLDVVKFKHTELLSNDSNKVYE